MLRQSDWWLDGWMFRQSDWWSNGICEESCWIYADATAALGYLSKPRKGWVMLHLHPGTGSQWVDSTSSQQWGLGQREDRTGVRGHGSKGQGRIKWSAGRPPWEDGLRDVSKWACGGRACKPGITRPLQQNVGERESPRYWYGGVERTQMRGACKALPGLVFIQNEIEAVEAGSVRWHHVISMVKDITHSSVLLITDYRWRSEKTIV